MDLVLTRGIGVQNPENLVDVICEWPLSTRSADPASIVLSWREREVEIRHEKRCSALHHHRVGVGLALALTRHPLSGEGQPGQGIESSMGRENHGMVNNECSEQILP